MDAVAPDGQLRPLGGFEAQLDPFSIGLTSAPTDNAAVVAYRDLFSGQVVARRFDRVPD